MASEESSEIVLIEPVYDGHTLPGLQHLAGDGLSVISIKVPHRNCKFTSDSRTNQPCISCAQDIQARNSYWNLQKPDLKKVGGLECSTTASVTQLLEAHNPKNAGKKPLKKRILRLLGSVVSKKPKHSPPQQFLTQNNWFRPHDVCVLSTIYEEMEVNQSGFVNSQEEMLDNAAGSSQSPIDTVYSLPPSSSLADSIDNTILNTCENSNQTNGDSGLHRLSCRFEAQELEIKEAHDMSLPINVLSGFKLEKKPPLDQPIALSHPSDLADIYKLQLLTSKEINNTASNFETEKDDHEKIDRNLKLLDDNRIQSTTEDHSEEIVNSLSKLLQDMENIEDCITRCHGGQFLMPEEKFENLPTFNNSYNTIIKQDNSLSKFSVQEKDLTKPQDLLEKELKLETTKSIMHISDTTEFNINYELESIKERNDITDKKKLCMDDCVDGFLHFSNTTTTNTSSVSTDCKMYSIHDIGTNNCFCHDNVERTDTFKTEQSSDVKCLENTFSDRCLSYGNKMFLMLPRASPVLLSETIYHKETKTHYMPESLSSNTEIHLNTTSEPENVVHLASTFLSGAHVPVNDNLPCSVMEMTSEEEYNQFVQQWNILEQKSSQYYIDLHQYQERRKLVNKHQHNCSDKFVKNNKDNLSYLKHNNEDIANAECLHKSSVFIQSVSLNNFNKISNESICDTSITENSEEQIKSNLNVNSDCNSPNVENQANNSITVIGDDLNSQQLSMDSIEKHDTQLSTEPRPLVKNMSLANMQDSDSNHCQCRLITVPDFCISTSKPCESSSKLIFSSPHIQLNLTNPLPNGNKK